MDQTINYIDLVLNGQKSYYPGHLRTDNIYVSTYFIISEILGRGDSNEAPGTQCKTIYHLASYPTTGQWGLSVTHVWCDVKMQIR